jgi:hypothetical protein
MSTETNAPQRRQAKSMPAVAAQPPLRMFIAHQRIATPRAVKQKWSNGPSPGFGHQCEQASCVWQRALTHLSSREPVNGSAHLIHPDMEGTSQPGDIKNLKQRTLHFSAPGLGTRYAAIPYIALANFRKRRDPRTNSEPKHSLLRWPVVSPSSGLTHVNVIPAPITGGSGNIFITPDTVEIDFIGKSKRLAAGLVQPARSHHWRSYGLTSGFRSFFKWSTTRAAVLLSWWAEVSLPGL